MPNNFLEAPVPAEYAAHFTNGEYAFTAALGSPTRVFSRWLVLRAGNYQIKLIAHSSATWVLTNVKARSDGGYFQDRKLLFTTMGYQGVQTLDFVVHKSGLKRLDILLQNQQPATIGSYVIFSIWQSGKPVYVSRAEGWVYNVGTTAIDPPDAPDERLAFPVLTVLPNWADGILERVSYLSSINESTTDAEQRRKMRVLPRRSFEASFLRDGARRARVDSFIAGIGSSEFMLPLWHEQLRMPYDGSPVSSFTQVTWPDGTLANREFLPNSLALIINNDPDVYDVVKILTVVGDTITFKSAPQNLPGVRARIIPLRRARVIDSAEMENVTGQIGQTSVQFEVLDYETYAPEEDWGYCSPLFRFRVNWDRGVTVGHGRKVYEYDVATGVTEVVDPGQRDRTSTRFDLTLTGREETTAFRKFISAARGKTVRFWAPSGTDDLTLVADINGSFIDAKKTGFAESFSVPQDSRMTLAIVFRDGRPTLYRAIESVTQLSDRERFQLSVGVPPVSRSEIERVQFMIPSRFDQDSFEFKHHVADCAVVTSSVMLRSAEMAGMEPIECFVTSEPYPLYEYDGIDTGLQLRSIRLMPVPKIPDGLDTGVALTTGTLRAALQGFSVDEDSINVNMISTSGALQAASVNYTADADGVESSVGVLAGSLRNASINYTMDSEGVNVALVARYGALFTE